MKEFKLLVLFLFCTGILTAQQKLETQVQNGLEKYAKAWDLSSDDIEEYEITDQYDSKHNGVTHVYVTQKYNDIPVYNAITGLHIKDNKVKYATNNFVKDLKSKIESSTQKISAQEALKAFALEMGILPEQNFAEIKSNNPKQILFEKTSFSKNDIPAKLAYFYDGKSSLRLAWNLEVNLKGNPDYYSVFMDAATGKVLHKINYTLHCKVDHLNFKNTDSPHDCRDHQKTTAANLNFGKGDGAQYRVYPFPGESPIHIDHQLAIDPASDTASPFGWHDIDGVEGADFTITRGNNVHAFLDQDDNDSPDRPEPDGGEALIFDFEHRVNEIPDSSINADVTNLFYYTNFMHDFSFYYGFDEAAGNFQETNYTGEGRGSDFVNANAHDDFGNGSLNNAFFGTPGDGGNPTMGMFQWNGVDPNASVRLTSPVEIEGDLESGTAGFGRPIGPNAVDGVVVVVDDDVSVETDGCESIVNDISGRVALIDRGRCEFGTKALNAENAGAIAVMICNVVGVNGGTGEEIINPAAGADGGQVTIPVTFLKKSDCDLIRMVIAGGTEVMINLQTVEGDTGPAFLSSSFDNGIIAHEYGHGISNRLTGGPSAAGCLTNDEQMGEGWSDFFTLITAHEEGDQATDRRGIGNYVATGKPNGRGIRIQPYSTDMNVNTKSYNDIRGTTAPHPLGEVWTATLWDMYWAFIEVYGFDQDFTNPNSGNSMAIQLVMDGMKLQRCSPGFLDGRDGILAADELLFDGIHNCMIWNIFANRGQGFNADQGLSNDRNDNEEGFETFPLCIEELKIDKVATELIRAGDDINVTLTVVNHVPNTLTDVTVADDILDGTFVREGSGSIDFTVQDDMILFNLGDLDFQDEVVITYVLETDNNLESTIFSFDNFEEPSNTLIPFPLELNNFEWEQIDFAGFESNGSWYIRNDSIELDQALSTAQTWTVQGELPVLKFVHKFDTEPGFDGGFVEVSTDLGLTWDLVPKDAFIKGRYNSGIAFSTFAIPALEGFSGQSDWIESFADLSAWLGQDILIRFRFGCDEAAAPDSDNPGWYVDNFGFIDLKTFDDGQACVTSAEGDIACDGAITLVNTSNSVSTNDILIEEYAFQVSPNPTSQILNISFNSQVSDQGFLEIRTIDGRKMSQKIIGISNGFNNDQLNVSSLSSGIYLLQLRTNNEVITHKFVKE